MEKIGDILKNLEAGSITLPPETITYRYPPRELTREEKREELRKTLGLSSLENTFESFLPEKGTEKALKACRSLASGKATWHMLLLYGGVGNGKTHLLEALVMEFYKRGIACRILNYGNMMRSLRQSMHSDSPPTFEGLLESWCRTKGLVIDDVGIGGSDTEWSMKMLEEIVLARYHGSLLTVLSTNMDIKELPERVVSRFGDTQKARTVLNEGEDYRPKKAIK